MNVEQLLQPAPGGIGRYTARLAALLPAQGVEVLPFCALHGRAERAAVLQPPPLGLPLPRPLLYDAWLRLGVPAPRWHPALRRADLTFAPSVAVPPGGGRPVVATVHDAAHELHPEAFTPRGIAFHRAGVAAAARRAALVLTVSQAARQELLERTSLPADRLRVVPNGVDLDVAADRAVADVRRRLGLDDRPYVLWVATLEPRKAVERLLEVPAALEAAGLPHRLVLGGHDGWGPTADAVRRAVADDRTGRLRHLGPVAQADLAPLQRGADLFCFPSAHEGFGLPVLEAMAQGTAVLCSGAGALPEVAGGAARLLDEASPAAWAAAVVALLEDEPALAALAAGGPPRAASFGWAACAAATAAAFREVLGGQ